MVLEFILKLETILGVAFLLAPHCMGEDTIAWGCEWFVQLDSGFVDELEPEFRSPHSC